MTSKLDMSDKVCDVFLLSDGLSWLVTLSGVSCLPGVCPDVRVCSSGEPVPAHVSTSCHVDDGTHARVGIPLGGMGGWMCGDVQSSTFTYVHMSRYVRLCGHMCELLRLYVYTCSPLCTCHHSCPLPWPATLCATHVHTCPAVSHDVRCPTCPAMS